MMLRLWDWQCTECGDVDEHLTPVPAGETTPRTATLPCRGCGRETVKERRLSIPAPYMGEKACNPVVRGGSFDTAGWEEIPELPQCPGEAEAQARATRAVASLPVTATREEIRAAALSATDGYRPKIDDYASHFETPEYKEVERKRKEVVKRNKQKRKRLKALKRGENVNFKRDRCAGDPSFKT